MDLAIDSRIRLNNGVQIPRLGLGVWQIATGGPTRDVVLQAFAEGYRHVDTARVYGNEDDVGRAVRDSGMPRADIFITTKLWNTDHGYDRALAAFDRSLARLGLDYVDLYLVHWPQPVQRSETWRALERIVDEGRARAVGVSNYMVPHLEELLPECDVVPAVNQIELSPFVYGSRRDVVELCRAKGIALEAYSPLTKGRRLGDPRLQRLAERYGRTPAQVLIRWALQRDFVVIPKSSNPDRIRENAGVFDFDIAGDDMAALDAMDEGLVTGWDPTRAP